jgi:hypothetical protein
MPGFPWQGKFQTIEEVEAYFAGEKIQCLLCGKWYKIISCNHLAWVHQTTCDAYRERFGLPWKRGLTGQHARQKYRHAMKTQVEAGKIRFDREPPHSPKRPQQPFQRDLCTRRLLAIHHRTEPWQRKDYEAILTRMQEQQRTLYDVCRDADLPGRSAWQNFVKQHPEFADKLQQVYFSLPYAVQLRSRKPVSPQFRVDCQRLRAQGMSQGKIAQVLGVSQDAVWRALCSPDKSEE